MSTHFGNPILVRASFVRGSWTWRCRECGQFGLASSPGQAANVGRRHLARCESRGHRGACHDRYRTAPDEAKP